MAWAEAGPKKDQKRAQSGHKAGQKKAKRVPKTKNTYLIQKQLA